MSEKARFACCTCYAWYAVLARPGLGGRACVEAGRDGC
jgi:hypothetical protein